MMDTMNNAKSFEGQTAIVTGGTGGLGTAICRRLSSAGLKVVANHHPGDADRAATWLSVQAGEGFDFKLASADVSDYDSCIAMATELTRDSTISVLVNNAGIVRDATLKNLEPHQWQAVIDTNLGSMYNVSRQFLPSMLEAGIGRIVNISSVNGQRGQFGQTNYSAAKAGVHGFTMALAQETASKGITVNSISPGFIDTEMVESIPDEQRNKIIAAIPVQRIGQPQDIANAVAFLASAESSYITGVNLAVNGGIFMH